MGAVTERLDPRDALVNRWNASLEDLPAGSRIGTSSPRRAAQLKRWAPQVNVLPVRGSVGTRIDKATSDDYDGVVLAAAGIIRLGLEGRYPSNLPADKFVPAPGQGALAAEIRSDDHATSWMLRSIDHTPTRRVVMAEMAFLERLGSGCQEPAAAYARVSGETMVMQVFLASDDGEESYYTKARGPGFQSPRVGHGGYPAAHREGSRGARAGEWAVRMLPRTAIAPVAMLVLRAW